MAPSKPAGMNISGPLSPSQASFASQKSPTFSQKSPRVLSPRSPDSQWSSFPDKQTSRVPPLTRLLLNGQLSQEYQAPLNGRQRFAKWMVDRGTRILWLTSFWLAHLLIFGGGVYMYQVKDDLTHARAAMPASFPIARAAALVLHVDVALILFPVCRSLISIMRRTILNKIVPFDDNISFHILIASAIGVFTVIHVLAHLANFVQITVRNGLGIKGFLLINFSTGPGWTGWIMLLIFGAMVWTSIEKRRRKNFERFWYTHHLMVLFFLFWALHGAFCMIASDYAAKCDNIQSGVLWKYWMYGALAYAIERAAREYRGRQPTMISKVIEHPSNVVEIQIKRPKTKTRAGQYIFLNCPEVSIYQYHPFTLTSAPEEDYISVHVRQVGDFTKALGKAVGCDKDDKSRGPPLKNRDSRVLNEDKSAVYAQTDFDQQLRRVLPKISIDGPFGSASEDVFQYEVSVLIGAGIGVTPFASILKSLWYRMNYPQQHAAGERALNRKVYFFWICRDFGSLEWFRSLLAAIEAADMNWGIEIHCYLTARITANDMANIAMNDVGQGIDGRDAITGLRTPTQFGRPNWEGIFRGLRRVHAGARAGVFFCGPGGLGKDLEERCKRFSGGLEGTRFVWGKENF